MSKKLCPTQPSCPSGQVRCWDNSCARKLSECLDMRFEQSVCPTNLKIRCPGGACRDKLEDCPTEIICPQERPIMCDDGNCRDSIL